MIRVANVTHHYGIRPVLRNFSMQVETGELVTLGAGLLPGWNEWFGMPMFVAGPISITLALFITLAAPPSMKNWHYTGRCRLSDNLPIPWGRSNSFDSSQFERQ